MERGELLYLSRADVEAVGLGVAEIVALVELALGAHGRGEVAIAPTTSLMPAPDTYLRAMAAHVPAVGAVGLKWLISAAHNPARGLPTIVAIGAATPGIALAPPFAR